MQEAGIIISSHSTINTILTFDAVHYLIQLTIIDNKMSRSDVNEMLNLCASNDLSFDALQERIGILGPRLSSQNQLCLHKACYNEKVTLKIVQLLYNTLLEAFRSRDNVGWLPIHCLCRNKNLDEKNSLDILVPIFYSSC